MTNTTIDAAELQELLASANPPRLVDVRTPRSSRPCTSTVPTTCRWTYCGSIATTSLATSISRLS